MPEYYVADSGDLPKNEMREMTVEGKTFLLVHHENGEFHALAAKCTHYGAPLAKGYLRGDRLICPWHHACFDVTNGRHLETPGQDGLNTFPLRIEGKSIFVDLPEGELTNHLTNPSSLALSGNEDVFVIVGGGPAGAHAAEGMREAGFTGKIKLISAEDKLPYDRTQVSKQFLTGDKSADKLPLRDRAFYQKHDVDLILGQAVTSIDRKQQTVTTDDGRSISFTKLLLCPGSTPNRLKMAGADGANVRTLRKADDAAGLRNDIEKGTKVVIIGASFIGMETAQGLSKLGADVTVVARDKVPFAGPFGEEIGRAILKDHREAGIHFELETEAEKLETADNRVTTIHLKNGKKLTTDLLVLGIGVHPSTGFLEDVLSLEKDGGIKVNGLLAVPETDGKIFAAGDISHYPYRNGHVRIEHWKVAGQQGRVAGMNMAGAGMSYRSVPFFWTAQQGTNYRYVGHAEDYDRIGIEGSVEEKKYIAHYYQNDKLVAALGVGMDYRMAELNERFYRGAESPAW